MRGYTNNDYICRILSRDVIDVDGEIIFDTFILQKVFKQMMIATETKFLASICFCDHFQQSVDGFIVESRRRAYRSTDAIFLVFRVRISVEILIPWNRRCSESTAPVSPTARARLRLPGRLWRSQYTREVLSQERRTF